MVSKLVRWGRPSGKICDACVSLPSSFCSSRRVCVLADAQACKAAKYLCHFVSTRATVRFSRSHVKPMKVGVDENGMSFDGSQGIPRAFEMLSMSVTPYGYGCSSMGSLWVAAKSRRGKVQSSSNSSMDPLGNGPPLNQKCPPCTAGPPFEAMRLVESRRASL